MTHYPGLTPAEWRALTGYNPTGQQTYEQAHDEAQNAYRTYERVQASANAAFAHYIRVRDKLKAAKAAALPPSTETPPAAPFNHDYIIGADGRRYYPGTMRA